MRCSYKATSRQRSRVRQLHRPRALHTTERTRVRGHGLRVYPRHQAVRSTAGTDARINAVLAGIRKLYSRPPIANPSYAATAGWLDGDNPFVLFDVAVPYLPSHCYCRERTCRMFILKNRRFTTVEGDIEVGVRHSACTSYMCYTDASYHLASALCAYMHDIWRARLLVSQPRDFDLGGEPRDIR